MGDHPRGLRPQPSLVRDDYENGANPAARTGHVAGGDTPSGVYSAFDFSFRLSSPLSFETFTGISQDTAFILQSPSSDSWQ
jgi:hypothetical protein